ncbi:MAG: MFS transporter [Chloroflexi bacterium RBG_19FT_COMBO_49_13]|nr:MAG: MFS transporter [Chloroflexi bacterium RBG_16_47_49]OGO62224.1 MAG: MFS transporter [Chloroflexi bacterium RBG_19FT_COMBO_49_13]
MSLPPPTSPTNRLHPNIWFLTIGSFLTDVSSEMLTNLIPLFLYNVLGIQTSIIGLIDGIAETTASLIKIYSGALSDRLGKRKILTVIGYALSTIAKPFLYFATTWGWVLGVRFTDRVGKGIRTAPRDALLAGSAKSDQRGFAFGLHRAGDTAGAFVGLGIAALIIWLTQSGSAQLTRHTFQLVVLASIIPAISAVLVLALGVKEIEVTRKGANGLPSLSWKALDKRFRAFLVVVVIFTLGNSSDSFIILRAQDRGLSVLQIMGMLMTFNAIYSLLAGPLGSLSDRFGRRRLMLIGWTIYGLVYLGLALSHTGAQIWALFGIYGIYYALTEGVAKALVADLVPQEQRGTAYGLFNAAIGLTALPASLIAGILWQTVSPAAPFIFGASLSLIAGFLLMTWVK